MCSRGGAPAVPVRNFPAEERQKLTPKRGNPSFCIIETTGESAVWSRKSLSLPVAGCPKQATDVTNT
jgi:hypothetical protein